jgi:hypothetical protein
MGPDRVREDYGYRERQEEDKHGSHNDAGIVFWKGRPRLFSKPSQLVDKNSDQRDYKNSHVNTQTAALMAVCYLRHF